MDGSPYWRSYPGNCPCPYNLAANGSHCGKRSTYSKPSGYAPLCYPTDTSGDMVGAYRAQHGPRYSLRRGTQDVGYTNMVVSAPKSASRDFLRKLEEMPINLAFLSNHRREKRRRMGTFWQSLRRARKGVD
jgi:hypothetical protein